MQTNGWCRERAIFLVFDGTISISQSSPTFRITVTLDQMCWFRSFSAEIKVFWKFLINNTMKLPRVLDVFRWFVCFQTVSPQTASKSGESEWLTFLEKNLLTVEKRWKEKNLFFILRHLRVKNLPFKDGHSELWCDHPSPDSKHPKPRIPGIPLCLNFICLICEFTLNVSECEECKSSISSGKEVTLTYQGKSLFKIQKPILSFNF